MPRRKLTRTMLLTEGNKKTLEEVMKMPRDEFFVNTILYNKISYNMYLDAYKYRHSIRDNENLPDYLKELAKIYELFNFCVEKLPGDLKRVYNLVFEYNESLEDVARHEHYSKTTIHRYKNLIVKSLTNCLNI